MYKVTLALLILGAVLSATVSIDQIASRPNRDEIYEKNGYRDIPLDDLEDPQLFVHQIVVFTFPRLEDRTLGGIKAKTELSTGRTVYLVIYDEIVPDEESEQENATRINSSESFVVLGQKGGNSFTVYENNRAIRNFDMNAMTYYDYKTKTTGKGPRKPEEPKPQSKPEPKSEPKPEPKPTTTTTPIKPSDNIQKKALQFLKTKVPTVKNYVLGNTDQTTKDNGDINICFTFEIPVTGNTKRYQKHCVIVHPDGSMELTVKRGPTAVNIFTPALP